MKSLLNAASISAVLTAGAILGSTALVDRVESHRVRTQSRQIVLNQLNTVRATLEGELQTHLAIAHHVAALAASRPDLDASEFTALAQTVLDERDTVTQAVWNGNDGDRLNYPAPPANPLPQSPRLNDDRPLFVLPRGDREPAIVALTSTADPLTADDTPVGTAVLYLDLDRLLAETDIAERTPNLEFSLRSRDPVGDSRLLLFGDRELFEARPVTADVSFPGGKWQIAGQPRGGWTVQSPLQPWIRGLGGLLAIAAAWGAAQFVRERRQRGQTVERLTAELRDREAKYRALVERSSVLLVHLDLDGSLIFANPYTQSFFGYVAAPLDRAIFAEAIAAPDFADLVRRASQNPDVPSVGELLCRRRNGETVWVEWHVTVLRDSRGEIDGLVGVGTDTSERQAAEHARHQSENQLRGLLAALDDSIVVLDASGRCLDVAPTARPVLPCCGAHFLGKTLHDVAPPSCADLLVQHVRWAIADDAPQAVEFAFPDPDAADARWLSANISPLNRESAVLVVRDISLRRRVEDELRHAKQDLEQRVDERAGQIYDANKRLQQEVVERMQMEEALRHSEEREREKAQQLERTLRELKRTQAQLVQTEKMSSLGQLAAGMAHEINNPVNFIYGNLTPIRDYAGDLLELIDRYRQDVPNPSPAVSEWIEDIDLDFLRDDFFKVVASMEVGAERIQKIIASLKNFSRLDEMGSKRVNLHDGIDSTLLVLQHYLRGSGQRPAIEVVREYGTLPLVSCLPNQINQVLTNLLENAADALEEAFVQGAIARPQITISTYIPDSQTVAIAIEDNGTGIPEAVQSQIFNPFFTTKPVGKGTGLGLSIAYQIVHDTHGGELRCHSQPGCTRFEILLPQSEDKETP